MKLASSGPQKAEKLCQICEKDGDLLDCTGPCLGTFHANCLGLKDTAAENFKCDECTTGTVFQIIYSYCIIQNDRFI